ncbi:hypothetical protein Pmani_023514 [Petrolisthes manimaculis]|uniref:Uncharacterized protein n=1 Tax=Petrolisthes manimaculis TaxID=1843537 RepID=A0AAE1PC91_9EUCA|nr:hypothetical protein Pmani_023514 [Petrolisthes manimaculis]
MLVPSQLRDRTSRCGASCLHRTHSLQSALRLSLLTLLEFTPWLVGCVIIYYVYCWWGIGSSFSVFLLIMGAHAIMRFLRTRGALPHCSRNLRDRDRYVVTVLEEPEEGEEEEEEQEEVEPAASALQTEEEDEKPPSYEAALVDPPPYDLHNHLTPTQPRSQGVGGSGEPSQQQHQQQQQQHQHFLEVPRRILGPKKTTKTNDDEDDNNDDGEQDSFLPSYHEAIKLSLCSD